MRDLLLSVNAMHWLLPALVTWPLVAAALVRFAGRDASQEDRNEAPAEGVDARILTLGALIVEGVLGVMLWFGYDNVGSGWQARVVR